MNHHDLQHGHDWSGENIAGWYASEKLDGYRALWTGSELVTQTGYVIPAADWFIDELPAGFPLDCELHAGRGRYQTAKLACQFGRWAPSVRLSVIDAPGCIGRWTDRLNAAAIALCSSAVASTVDWWLVETVDQLGLALARIHHQGGEGIVVRDPASMVYRPGRNGSILKIKWQFPRNTHKPERSPPSVRCELWPDHIR